MYKKSQAALEFLTTYAWAFLVILIMIGALSYFGVLSPSKILPDRCTFGGEIGCDKNKVVITDSNTDTLRMSITNNFGTAVIVQASSVVEADANLGACTAQIANAGGTPVNIPGGGYTWEAGNSAEFAADCAAAAAALVAEEKMKFKIEIDYYPVSAGSGYAKTVFGEIFGTIQAP
jgi:hypothetical protein